MVELETHHRARILIPNVESWITLGLVWDLRITKVIWRPPPEMLGRLPNFSVLWCCSSSQQYQRWVLLIPPSKDEFKKPRF